jgi:hypothetical protein
MKLVPILVCAAVVAATLAGCDSTGPKTVTKTVVDTVYQNDRFARNAPVVDGEWTISTATDTADGFFFQDSQKVSAIIVWKRSPAWTLAGSVTDTGITLYSSARDTAFYGDFTDSANSLKTGMSGNYLFIKVLPTGTVPTWKAVRKT